MRTVFALERLQRYDQLPGECTLPGSMMKLSTMQDVVSTVDDKWESPLADQLVQCWEHDAGRPKYWRASANLIFFFKNHGQDHVLRFNHSGERTAEAVYAELDFVNALAGAGIQVARPVRSLTGHVLESIATARGVFHTVVFEALPGKQFDLEELTAGQIARWGRALGELHNAAAQYAKPGRPRWDEQLAALTTALPAEDHAAQRALARITAALSQLVVTGDNFGLIHFDFEPDNLVWNDDSHPASSISMIAPGGGLPPILRWRLRICLAAARTAWILKTNRFCFLWRAIAAPGRSPWPSSSRSRCLSVRSTCSITPGLAAR